MKRMTTRAPWLMGLFLICCFQIGAATSLQKNLQKVTEVEGVSHFRLSNGLEVLLIPDEAKPTTTVNMTYRVGSRHENYGQTGMAHLLEHMLFKGSKRFPQAWAEFSQRGMRANGTTWIDRTNYFASFSANDANLRWYLSWQADAMINARIARADLNSEMTVVRNEMEANENNPGRVLFNQTLATMYQWHNYGKSTIGARSDVEGVDVEQLRAFYRTYYQPDNATLVISGKFPEKQILQWVQETFGRIPKPQRALPRLYTLEPTQDGERSITLRRVGGAPMVQAAYHVPAGAHPDTAAWEMLTGLLADDSTGRLQSRLVDAQKAAAIFGFNVVSADPGFAIFGAQLGPDHDVKMATDTLLDALENSVNQTFTAADLERVRAKWLKNWELAFTDPEQVGVSLSEYIALGDWRLFFLMRDRIKAVTLADVQRVAQASLVQSNRTLGTYIPTPAPQRAPTPQHINVAEQFKQFQPGKAAARVAAFNPDPAYIESQTRRQQLPSGLQVSLLNKATRGNIVSATLVLQTGNAQALRGPLRKHITAAALLPALLKKGAGGLSRAEIEDRLTALKAEINFSGNAEGVTASITTQEAHLPEVIALLGKLLRQPHLEESALEEIRQQALTDLQQAQTEPQSLVTQALQQALNPYPADDVRYVPTHQEQIEMIKKIQRSDLREFHEAFWGASFGQFSAVGPLNEVAVLNALHATLDDWTNFTPYKRIERPLPSLQPSVDKLSVNDKANAVLGMVLPLPVRELDAHHAALLVANYIWGGSGHSRLWTRIREKEGLSYDVRSQISFNSFEASSQWSVSAIFAPQNLAAVQQAITQELDKSLEQGFTAAEVAAAKQGLLRLRQHARAQDEVLARSLANNDFLGRTFMVSKELDDAIQRVTVAQVSAAWKQFIQPSAMRQVVAGTWAPAP